MNHEFIQITLVWAHYFKLFNRVQSTQDEKACFSKENELKLSYFHSLFLRDYSTHNKLHSLVYSSIWYFIDSNNCIKKQKSLKEFCFVIIHWSKGSSIKRKEDPLTPRNDINRNINSFIPWGRIEDRNNAKRKAGTKSAHKNQ